MRPNLISKEQALPPAHPANVLVSILKNSSVTVRLTCSAQQQQPLINNANDK